MIPSPRRRSPIRSRAWAIQRLRWRLERDAWPRVQMALLVALTGAAGFLASFALLHAGLDAMWLRYPLAVGIAYAVFLLLLWLWLRTRAEDYADLPLPSEGSAAEPGAASGAPDVALRSGGGGDFGGGGASAGFDAPASPGPLDDGLSFAGDAADEWAVPLALLLLVLGLALSSLYVVYSAPVLMAELLLDGALATTLYRRLRVLETRHWLQTALRRTALPFGLTAAFLGAAGWAFHALAPQACSLGEVLRSLSGGT